jgi:hypothetical protein
LTQAQLDLMCSLVPRLVLTRGDRLQRLKRARPIILAETNASAARFPQG